MNILHAPVSGECVSCTFYQLKRNTGLMRSTRVKPEGSMLGKSSRRRGRTVRDSLTATCPGGGGAAATAHGYRASFGSAENGPVHCGGGRTTADDILATMWPARQVPRSLESCQWGGPGINTRVHLSAVLSRQHDKAPPSNSAQPWS